MKPKELDFYDPILEALRAKVSELEEDNAKWKVDRDHFRARVAELEAVVEEVGEWADEGSWDTPDLNDLRAILARAKKEG